MAQIHARRKGDVNMKRKLMWSLTLAVAAVGTYVSTLVATPANPPLFVGTTIATGRFDEFDVLNHTVPGHWRERLKTKGQSDLYVQSNVWKPGGTTGWHTHPGASLVIITGGSVTAYEGDDPTCTPHLYVTGDTFVDPGGGHVHVVRNEGNVDATGYAVQLIPAGAVRREDADRPARCPSTVN
jgi:quercetin dioxygenase-like cupin family protein